MGSRLVEILKANRVGFSPVIEYDWKQLPRVVFDFSEANMDLTPTMTQNTDAFTNYISALLVNAGATVGIGKYNENRVIYRWSHLFKAQEEPRSIHLGIDIFCAMGTPIYVPLDGKIHSFNNNNQPGDYGGTLILEHHLNGLTFYTLYGHLSIDSLEGKTERQRVKQGTFLARLGSHLENGGWPPHLHFQIIKDMKDYKGDFPGVCSPSERDEFLRLCPNPNYILQIPGLDPL
jgi:peptidoglycan LD-endopeptidase LytH